MILSLAAGSAAVVALSLAGCTTASQSGTPAAVPQAGDCWSATYAAATRTVDWEGSADVACGTAHQLDTYAVISLRGKAGDSWIGTDGTVPAAVVNYADHRCLSRLDSATGLQADRSALLPLAYLPSAAQISAGARWVRCDVAVFHPGSSVRSPRLGDIRTDFDGLAKSISAMPAKFALCENDPANNGPDGELTTFADCSRASDWSFLHEFVLDGGGAAVYPGAAATLARGTKLCKASAVPQGHELVVIYPTAAQWAKYGDRFIDCWVNNN